MDKKTVTCTICPKGCSISVSVEGGKVLHIEGQGCKKGYEYACAEAVSPTRILTTTMRIEGGIYPVIPVKTSMPIPKGKMAGCMKVINSVKIKAPVNMGFTAIPDILGTGVDVITTRSML
jgi:CxxC motif-containing protein